MLKNFFNHVGLVNKADDAHLSVAFGTAKRVWFINFSDKVGPSQDRGQDVGRGCGGRRDAGVGDVGTLVTSWTK